MGTRATVDGELSRMLESSDADRPVEAVFRLRPESGQVLIDPGVTEQVSREVIQRAEKASGEKTRDCNVFKNLGSFMVSAPASLIRAILDQPEIAGALANRRPGGSATIEPVAKRPAELPKPARSKTVKAKATRPRHK